MDILFPSTFYLRDNRSRDPVKVRMHVRVGADRRVFPRVEAICWRTDLHGDIDPGNRDFLDITGRPLRAQIARMHAGRAGKLQTLSVESICENTDESVSNELKRVALELLDLVAEDKETRKVALI